MGPIYSLSLYDLMKVDGFAEAYGKQDIKEIEKHLWTNGMDINHWYEEEEYVLHRPLTAPNNEPIQCNRYTGAERLDREYIRSGCASLEATITSTGDADMVYDLNNMSKQGYSSQCGYSTDNYDKEHVETFNKKRAGEGS